MTIGKGKNKFEPLLVKVMCLLLMVSLLMSDAKATTLVDIERREPKLIDALQHLSLISMAITKAVVVDVAEELSDEEDLPFDNNTWDGFILNWIAKLLLWFVYLMTILLILGGTIWSLGAQGFWSWALCLFWAFFYAMLLGRYWGYSECLIGFVILFSAIKISLRSDWIKKKMNGIPESELSKRLRKRYSKSPRANGNTNSRI
jgi:hypothetical protein